MGDPETLTREDIGLRAPTRRPIIVAPRLRVGIVAHHNGPLVRLDTSLSRDRLRRREIAYVRAVQNYHQGTLGWSDWAYSWAIGQTGILYEGRGLRWDQFANGADVVHPDDGPDRVWYTVLFMIGWDHVKTSPTYGREEEPTDEALETFDWLIGHVRAQGAGRRVLPHNDFKIKRCPGRTLSLRCDERDGKTLPVGAVAMTFGDQIDQWRQEYNQATIERHSQVVEWVQRFLIDQEHLAGAPDGLKGPTTDAAFAAFKSAAAGTDDPNPHAGRRAWRLMFEHMFPNNRGADLDRVGELLGSAADDIHQAQRIITR